MQRIRIGEVATENGVIISIEDYYILKARKEYLQRCKELEARLNAGEDV